MQSRLSFSRTSALLVALLASFLVLAPPAQADENAPENPIGCATNVLADGDDAFAASNLGFTINVGDVDVNGVPVATDEIFVSENGIVSFDNPIDYWYDGFDLRDVTNFFGDAELIAPLFADAVRGESGSVTYGQADYLGRSAFCVQWNDLEPFVPEGFYNPADIPSPLPVNNFELIIVERSDRASGDFDIVINYESIQWDDVHCQQGFDGEFDLAAARAPGQFNGCCNDFGQEIPCFGDVGFRADVERVDAPIMGFAALEAVNAPVFPYDNVGALAGISFSSGFSAEGVIEFPGSGDILQMVDADGLAARSLNSLQAGRFVIEVEGGFNNSDLGSIVGLVTREDNGAPIVGAIVETCITTDDMEVPLVNCQSTVTDANGSYEVGGAPEGAYRITAFGPSGSSLFPSSVTVEVDFTFTATLAPEIVLSGPEELPAGLDFGPTSSWGQGITVYWGEDLSISVAGCIGGTGTWVITAEDGPDAGGDLTESDGTYTGVVPALNPTHGQGELVITIVCPDPADNQDIGVGLYIDPSGEIFEIHSGDLVEGATATLFRSAGGELGPFEAVPDGSAIMSPSNRTNPFVVDASGRFGWDVIEGYYVVEATKAGCDAIAYVDDATPASSTAVLEVQPEWLGLKLYLDCNNEPTIAAGAPITLEAPVSGDDLVPPATADLDPTDILTVTSDAPAELPLGDTTVTWTVVDPDGAMASTSQVVTVQDTTAPSFEGIPNDQTLEATSDDGATFSYLAPTVTDSVDPNPTVVCSRASGSVFPLGLNAVTCVATDASNNEAITEFSVTVVDSSPPTLAIPLSITETSIDGGPAVLEFTSTATDAVDGPLIAVCTPPSGSLFQIGETAVSCTATDAAGNATTGSFVVTLIDGQDVTSPVVTVPADFTVEAVDVTGAVVTFEATAMDGIDGALPVTCTPASGTLFPIGATNVVCEAIDNSGNPGAASFVVMVNDPVAPTGDIRGSIRDIADALGDLDGLNRWDRKRVRFAIAYLDYADRDSLWADDERLTDRRGRIAQWALRVAVSKLSSVKNKDVRPLNEALVQQMRELAVVELGDAVDAGGNPHHISRGERHLMRGDDRSESGRLSSAAYYFSRAWFAADAAF